MRPGDGAGSRDPQLEDLVRRRYAVASFDGAYTGTPLLLEDTEIDCQNTPGTAISETNVTARRLNIHGCENGLNINQNVTVEDSYIHDLYNSAEAHSDGIQFATGHLLDGQIVPGVVNVTIRHNTIYGMGADGSFGTSAIIDHSTAGQHERPDREQPPRRRRVRALLLASASRASTTGCSTIASAASSARRWASTARRPTARTRPSPATSTTRPGGPCPWGELRPAERAGGTLSARMRPIRSRLTTIDPQFAHQMRRVVRNAAMSDVAGVVDAPHGRRRLRDRSAPRAMARLPNPTRPPPSPGATPTTTVSPTAPRFAVTTPIRASATPTATASPTATRSAGTTRTRASATRTATGTATESNCVRARILVTRGVARASPAQTRPGVPAGIRLTAYTGPSTISTPNTVISGKTMGCVRVTAPGVVIRNSKISCSESNYAVLSGDGDYAGAGLRLEDTEIDCRNTNGTAVGEANVTARRLNIHGARTAST